MFVRAPPKTGDYSFMGTPPCSGVKSSGYTVEGVTYGPSHLKGGYVLKFDNGKTGWMSDTEVLVSLSESEHAERVKEKADCDRRGGVSVGMTRAQVYASCWGKPQTINKTVGSYGTHEQLVYGGSNYLYLENGIVRSIQTSEH